MRTSIASSLRTTLIGALLLCSAATPAPAAPDRLNALLDRFTRAMRDPGVALATRYKARGSLAGAGLWGDFILWVDGSRQREDDTFGPGMQAQFIDGDRVAVVDSNGIVRRLQGLLLRRERTLRLIEDGTLAASPDCCTLKGDAKVAGRQAIQIEVAPKDGEAQTLFLDAQSALPLRVEYDDADGRTTVDYADWRSAGGRRFAFRRIESNGDHRYDVRQTTESIDLAGVFDASIFTVPPTRLIEIAAPETIPLEVENGHYFVRTSVDGKPLRFLLDSGSEDILIDRAVAKRLDLYEQGDLQALGTARTGGVRASRVGKVCVGGACMRDVAVNTLDLSRTTEGSIRADGIIGYPFFGQAVIELDLRNARMRVGRPGAWKIAGERIEAEFDRSLPQATMRANDAEGTFLIDTGNSGEMMLFGSFLNRHPGLVAASFTVRSGVGVGGYAEMYRTNLGTLRIGSFLLNDLATDVVLSKTGAFADRSLAGDAGAGVLRRFVVTFDLPNDALYFAPA